MTDLDALLAACDDSPDDTPRLVMADYLDDHGQSARAAIFRAVVSTRRHETAAGIAAPDRYPVGRVASEGWALIAPEVEELAAAPENTPAFRARLEGLLRGDVPLAPECLEATLRLQYDLQVRLLASLNLLDERDGELWITAIDGQRYPLPVFEDVLARMQTPKIERKLTQGFDTFLLVPSGLPLERITAASRQGLRRNAATFFGVGAFNEIDLFHNANHWGQYPDEPLMYDPRSFTADHGGRTKEELLRDEGRGWDILLVEGALQNVPRTSEGREIGGRRQLECGAITHEYLAQLHDRGEAGLTPEAYGVAFLDALERRGQVLDTRNFCFLLGAFQPSAYNVPGASWSPVYGRLILDMSTLERRDMFTGVRGAVRVS